MTANMIDFDFDLGDLNSLIAQYGLKQAQILPEVRAQLKGASLDIKEDWRDFAVKANPEHAKRYPFSIDFDIFNELQAVRSVIGPNLGRAQGALGILEDASGGVRAAPQRSGEKALRKNLATLEARLLAAAGVWL